ncbi:polysaccharide deacetylase [Nostoc carneum NIES-2107]|nr:polysaccharide deacetylase [Nostoc carneum NIES-2107]
MIRYGFSHLRKIYQQIRQRLASKAVILMYHRIAEVDIDPWGLCVTPQNFAQQLEVLKQYTNPLSLQKFVTAYRNNKIPHRAVVITFDDGYIDNLHHAKPLLENYNIPATIFISTGYLEQQREFWWDELERILLQIGKLPEQLTLSINGNVHQWELGTVANYSKEEYQRDRTCKAWEALPGSRMNFYYKIWQILQPLPTTERLQLLADIDTWTNNKSIVSQASRPLLVEELSALAEGKLIEIGAHTVSHLYLSRQSKKIQLQEILQSKIDLEKILARPVTSFSYPFGDRTAETVELTKAAGFNCACSTDENIIWQSGDYFQLPRIAAANWNREEFLQQLLKWF